MIFDDEVKGTEFEEYYELGIFIGQLINAGIQEGKFEQLIKPLFNLVEEMYRVSMNSNIARLSAQMYKEKYEAYLDAGFNHDQSFKLLIADRQDFSRNISNLGKVKK